MTKVRPAPQRSDAAIHRREVVLLTAHITNTLPPPVALSHPQTHENTHTHTRKYRHTHAQKVSPPLMQNDIGTDDKRGPNIQRSRVRGTRRAQIGRFHTVKHCRSEEACHTRQGRMSHSRQQGTGPQGRICTRPQWLSVSVNARGV